MLLDLIITHWTEPWEIVRKGFMMLSLQRGVDWDKIKIEVIHDGSECWPDEYFDFCPFKVHQTSISHRGIAGVRNYGIDHSEAEWIKFNDCDDMFNGIYALKTIMNKLEAADKYDMLWFDLYSESLDNIVSINKKRDLIFTHGKVFRRSFLNDRHLRFNEELTWCEDSAFLAVVEMEIDPKRILKIDPGYPLYAYIARSGSLCNRPEIFFANLQSFFKRHCYVAEEFRKHRMMHNYYAMCYRTICDSYYTLCRAPGITQDKSEHEAAVWKWYESHKQACDSCSPEVKRTVIEAVNMERGDGGVITKGDVAEWIRKHTDNQSMS